MNKIYITTTIPYVNAEPHVGFALELVQADVLARYHRLNNRDVYFQTGTDENALKNVLAAAQRGLSVQELVDRNAGRFHDLLAVLAISADGFVRTSGDRHRRAVQAFWQVLDPADVVRKAYTGLYCTGCEDFYLPRDLPDGRCPEHGNSILEVAEENYFFSLPNYQQFVETLLAKGPLELLPPSRVGEVLAFARQGLHAFSISRSARRAGGWATPVPNDPDQVVYVWVDALVNYLTGLGYGTGDRWQEWWSDDVEKIHVIGKNVWKFHAIYWPALLRSAGLPAPDQILVHGFLTVEGQKISKTLGNVVDPFELVSRFGCDALRYYLLRSVAVDADGDFTEERLRALYHADLANGLGNLVSRLAKLGERAGFGRYDGPSDFPPPAAYREALLAGEFNRAVAALWAIVGDLNRRIEAARPWELLRNGHSVETCDQLRLWLSDLRRFTQWLEPILPGTAGRIKSELFSGELRAVKPLFPRLG